MNIQANSPVADKNGRPDITEAAMGIVLQMLWRQLSPRRRKQFFLVLTLMLISALAEVVTLGAVLPFLAVVADPNSVTRYPAAESVLGILGLTQRGDLLLALTLVFAITAAVAGGVRVLLAWVSNKYVFMLGHDLGMAVYQRVLYQPYTWHVSKNTSEIIGAIQKVQIVTSEILLQSIQMASAVIIGIFIIVALITVAPFVSFTAFVGFGLIYFGVSILTSKTLKTNSKTIAQSQTNRIQSVQEGLGSIRDVILDGSQPVYLDRFQRLDSAFRSAQAASAFIGASPRFVIEAAGMVLIVLLAYVLTTRDGGLVAVLPVLGALALGAQRLLPLMQIIYNGWTRFAGNKDVLNDVLALLEARASTIQLEQTPELTFEREIKFRKVSFAYEADLTPVLQNIDLSIPKGSRVGIIGKTGSGKSTMVDLLMGLLTPLSGEITIDEQRLDNCNRRAWQSQIAHVPQAIYLTDATIAENIAFGVEPARIDYPRVYEAAERAQMATFIKTLAHGYETVVGERGVRLSGGQRQRVGIARALYRRADVLFFDEATSALDKQTETAITEAIGKLGREITIFIVAHRLSTLAACDQILCVDAGRIESKGKYNEYVEREFAQSHKEEYRN